MLNFTKQPPWAPLNGFTPVRPNSTFPPHRPLCYFHPLIQLVNGRPQLFEPCVKGLHLKVAFPPLAGQHVLQGFHLGGSKSNMGKNVAW